MLDVRELKSRYNHFLLVLIFIPLLLWFGYCEKTITSHYTIVHSSVDDYIPFIKQFIIPYLSWFPYIGFGLLYSGIVYKKEYYRLCTFMFTGMAICYVIFMVCPNGLNMRPAITQHDILSRLVAYIYRVDTPANVTPSIHILNSIGVNTALVNCARLKKRKKLIWISNIWMILICMSTLFVKQHSVIDVLWAIVLSAVLYIAIFAVPKVYIHVKTIIESNAAAH